MSSEFDYKNASEIIGRDSISVVLPAYNEEGNIQEAINVNREFLYKVFEKVEIIVVNDGSMDRTAELADQIATKSTDVKVIHHEQNQGYGAALRSGFSAAKHELVFFTDSDLQFDIKEITRLLPLIKTYDIVSGYREKRADSSIRLLNAWAWNKLVRFVLGVKARDIDCAFKLIRKEVLDHLTLTSQGAMINTEFLALANKNNFSFYEVPVSHFPRVTGDQTGADIRVVIKAFVELFEMHKKLKISSL